MLQVGYRYQLEEATYPTVIKAGDNLSLEMIWRNTGYAPSYPRMGQTFSLHLYVIDSAGVVAGDAILPASINAWMPAETFPGMAPVNEVSALVELPTVPGAYLLKVGIVEERTGNLINLAIAGRDAAGRYPIGSITIE
jgi:hypothetical protein